MFADFVRRELPLAAERVNLAAWLDGPGVPGDAPVPSSVRLDAITAIAGRNIVPEQGEARRWTPAEWQLYLETLERPATLALCQALEERFHLTQSPNYEVLVSWLIVAAHAGFAPSLSRTEEVFASVGRMKYLKPLYQALAARPETHPVAVRCFAANKAGYHPIARQVVEALLKKAEQSHPA